MTRDDYDKNSGKDDAEKDDGAEANVSSGNGATPEETPEEQAREDETENRSQEEQAEDEFTLAFLPPHTRMHYDDAEARLHNALASVNPERAVEFLHHMHGPQAAQEALLRALTAERVLHRISARYWLDVYDLIVGE